MTNQVLLDKTKMKISLKGGRKAHFIVCKKGIFPEDSAIMKKEDQPN